jgi:hypothetical protein
VPPPGFPDKRTAPGTSCDPAETGRDPKDHYDKDVARCDAMFLADGQDLEEQEGSQRARLAITNGYPSYHCTAWFDIHNNGTIPVHLHSVLVMGAPVIRCEQGGSTPFDLSGDGAPDIEICVSDLPAGEPQIHPSEEFQFNLDIHIMQTAPQGATLEFTSTICLHQWNEEIGVCPLAGVGCAGAIEDICVDADGIASAGDGIPGAIETSLGDALTAWPTGIGDQGIDGFDNDASGTWTVGDDIHLEATGPVCTTGIRNALHDLGDDCKVLDYNGSLFNGQLVDCDFEGGIDFNPGPAGCDPLLKFHDANSDGFYDDAEDIILDTNNNGVFD